MRAIWFLALSDLLINLSAGWFGAAIIFPLYAKRAKVKQTALISNVLFGIFALLIAVVLRDQL